MLYVPALIRCGVIDFPAKREYEGKQILLLQICIFGGITNVSALKTGLKKSLSIILPIHVKLKEHFQSV